MRSVRTEAIQAWTGLAIAVVFFAQPAASDGVREMSFPFGAAVLARPPSGDAHRPLFVLGAYPSALHVRWTPPSPGKPIRAIPVDNEPEPFWDGHDQAERVRAWSALHFEARWGTVEPAGALNGSSGEWVSRNILAPLAVSRGQAWITDVLDTYRCSDGVEQRIGDTYSTLPATLGMPAASLLSHPSEAEIVKEGLGRHRERLLKELATANPDRIVTLGNAALRVMRELLAEHGGAAAPEKLSAGAAYGRPIVVHIAGRDVEWFPLAHPAAPAEYQDAHVLWMALRPRSSSR